MQDLASSLGDFIALEDLENVQPDMRVGFILMNKFTLAPVAGLVESLRFAADKEYRSQQIYCQWDWMTFDNQPVTASCGLLIHPTAPFDPFNNYDYVVLAGGLLSETRAPSDALVHTLQQINNAKISIIALCSASFVLGKAGILDQRKCAIHYAIIDEFKQKFPKAKALIDDNFIEDGGIYTCPGGTAIGLATALIRKNCSNVRAQKSLDYLLLPNKPAVSGPTDSILFKNPNIYENEIVKKAITYMRENLSSQITMTDVAKHADTNTRQLHRAFAVNTNESPASYWRRLRLEHARFLLTNTSDYVTNIAMECGFSDASHFISWFKKLYGETPYSYRKRRHEIDK
ncbi:MAG: GlxA family transcriptional regulator [Paenalcaligenes sp.]